MKKVFCVRSWQWHYRRLCCAVRALRQSVSLSVQMYLSVRLRFTVILILQIHKKIRQGNDPCHYAVMNAGGGTRTHTPLRATDFESASSANSDTPAHLI